MYTIEELNAQSVEHLKDIAVQLGIRRSKNFTKEELVYSILDEQAMASKALNPLFDGKDKSATPIPPERTKRDPAKEEKSVGDTSATTSATAPPSRRPAPKRGGHSSLPNGVREGNASSGESAPFSKKPPESRSSFKESSPSSRGAVHQGNKSVKPNRQGGTERGENASSSSAEAPNPAEALRPFPLKVMAEGVLEQMPDGYGFLRSASYHYMTSPDDIYISAAQVKAARIKTGDTVRGYIRPPREEDSYYTLLSVEAVNGKPIAELNNRSSFQFLTPAVFLTNAYNLREAPMNILMRIVDFFAPIGKGQRGMIVAQPKTGKTVLL